MPKLPSINKAQSPGPLNLPRPTGEDFGSGVGKGAAELGGALAEIGRRIQDGRDDLEITKLGADYNAGIKEIETGLIEVPFQEYEKEFTKSATKLQKSIRNQATNRRIGTALDRHFSATFPEQIVNARGRAQSLDIQRQIVDLDRLSESMALDVVGASDDKEVEDFFMTYESLVQRAQDRGTISPIVAEKFRKGFKQNIEAAGTQAQKLGAQKAKEQRAQDNLNFLQRASKQQARYLWTPDWLRLQRLSRSRKSARYL